MKKTIHLTLIILFSIHSLIAQKGKDGIKNISTANVKVNEFTSLAANATAGSNIITVAANGLNTNSRFTTTLTVGDLVMIIQMQGALMKLSPVPVWAPDSTYGRIYNNGYQSSGNYEFAQVKSIISNNQIELDCGLQNAYTVSGKTQIVRVPRYSSLTIASTGTLTTDAWNGTTGGILVAEVDGNTTINTGGIITATGLGFRGGIAAGNGGTGNGNYATKNPDDGAKKGEGIGSDRLNNTTHDTLGLQCMGAPANGGGGGDANNCGGGGGANAGNINNWSGYGIINPTYSAIYNLEYNGRGSVVSSGGGKGGYGTSGGNSDPTVFGPNNTTAWGSYSRPSRGGFGGHPLDYSLGKLFLGGGGGAGHMSVGQSNGTNACSGGNGGGIIYLLNYGTISGTGTITADGANGNNSFGSLTFSNPSQGIDGAGGGGGGGAIILNSIGTITSINTNANGGKGGNQVKFGTTNSEAQGPGGGGGGGYIASNGSVFTQSVNGGSYGTTNNSNFSSFPMNGATSGDVGLNNQVINNTFSITTISNQTICLGSNATLTATTQYSATTIQWYSNMVGGSSIATGTIYTSPTYTAIGTYSVYVGSCPGIYRKAILITVNASSISVNSATICAGQTATLIANSSATSYTWSNGSNTNFISVTPSVTTSYSLSVTNGNCFSKTTATVTVNNNLNVTVNSPSICIGQTATLTANGASTYSWSNGSASNFILVNPNTSTTYTVYGTSSACNGMNTSTVKVLNNPTVTVNSATICSGQSATLTANGCYTYSWSSGATTNSIISNVGMTYTVIGTDINGCQDSKTASVSVNQTPTITVNSETICIGTTVTLTAIGATSYTWNTGATTHTIAVTPLLTTNYTVTGTILNCSNQATTTVIVISSPTIYIASATICGGETTTLTANGANTYTWSNGFIGNSQSLNPLQTSTYSAIGSIGNCEASSNTATISVTPIIADFNLPSNVVTVNTAINLTNNSTNATLYTWSFCDGSVSTTTSPSITLSSAGNCCFTLTAINGACNQSTIKCVDVILDAIVVIPNVFTPNGDGKNDAFKITFSGLQRIYVTLYNRWGKPVYYKSYDGQSGFIEWNGITSNNTEASDGTYYFLVEYTDLKNNSKIEKGFFNLFRD